MKCITSLLLTAVCMAGCSQSPAAQPAAGKIDATTQQTNAPSLSYSMSAEPATIYKQEVPSTASGPRTIAFRFVADNKGKQRFGSEAPTSAIVRVTVKHGDEVLWDGPEMSLQVITPVEIGANAQSVYTVNWEIEDVAKLPTGKYEVVGTFTPTGGQAKTTVEVKERM